MRFRTQGRDLDTIIKDYVAEQDKVYNIDEFHAASLRYPPDVTRIKLKGKDKTPEQGIRTLTVEAIEGDPTVQRQIDIWHPDSNHYVTYNVKLRTVMTFSVVRRGGHSYIDCTNYGYVKY